MSTAVEGLVAEIRRGKRAPAYLLFGDEFLTREGARALVDALVPPDRQPFSVELLSEEQELASVPMRLATVSLFGGTKVVVVHDSKAFVSKQNAGKLFDRSREDWTAGDTDRAVRLFLQGLAASGSGEEVLSRAVQGTLSDEEWQRLAGEERDGAADAWLQEVAGQAVRDGRPIPAASAAAQVYEDLLARGLPAESVLILTCEVVDERRALFKKLAAQGAVVDCSLRSKKGYDTQMIPEAARGKIREMVAAAGKTIAPAGVDYILERTGFSMRGLVSEMEKLVSYVGARPAILLEDVAQVLSGSRDAGIFDLTNAVSERDAARAIRALRALLTQREPVAMLMGLLAKEIRNLILSRGLLDEKLGGQFNAGTSYATFQARILPRLKPADEAGEEDKGGRARKGGRGGADPLGGIHPFRLYNMLRAAARFSQDRLLEALEDIADTDIALKTSGQPEALLLEGLVLRLCAV